MIVKRKTQFPLGYLGIGCFLVLFLFIACYYLFNHSSEVYDQSIVGESITHLVISTNTGNILVSPYEGETIRTHLIGENGAHLTEGYRLSVKAEGNVAKIKAKRKSKKAQDFVVEIEVPSKIYDQIQIEGEVANIELNGVHASKYVLTTSVGNIRVGAKQGIIHAAVQVGNVHVQVETIANDMIVKAEVGTVLVETNETPEALQVVAYAEVGTVTMDLPNMQDGIIGKGGPLLDLQTNVGDVSLLLGGE